MELRQLECFYMVTKLSNFTKAAEQLHVSQPAITKAIRCLEKELNVQLFDRGQKQVTLTVEGKAFLAQTERILSSVNEAVLEMNNFQNAQKGEIKLGVPPMIGAYLFPDIMARFKLLYPSVDCNVFEDGSSSLVSKIQKGALDLAIAILPENICSLKTVLITEEEYLLCVHPNYHLNRHRSASFSQLQNEPFILLNSGNYQYHTIIQRCLLHNYTPNIILTSSQFETVKGLVANGLGISFLMRMAIDDDPNISTIPLDEPIKINIGLIWRENRYLSHTCRAFIKFIKEYAKTTQAVCPANKTLGSRALSNN